MNKLRACPFCGTKPEIKKADGDETCVWVECQSCGANQEAYDSELKAITAWNKRKRAK